MTRAVLDDVGEREFAVEGGTGDSASATRPWWRLGELVFVFVLGPLAFPLLDLSMRWLMPTMIGLAVVCFLVLWFDRSFDRRRLWNWRGLRRRFKTVLAAYGVGVSALMLLMVAITLMKRAGWIGLPPEVTPAAFPLRAPALWVMVMLGYPLLSVYPQEVIFRAFVFHRYRRLVPVGWPMVVVSALVFGWAHLPFENWFAVPLTVVGGLLFSWTYYRSDSLAAAWLEHALYGCATFTIGLGWFFYAGSVQ